MIRFIKILYLVFFCSVFSVEIMHAEYPIVRNFSRKASNSGSQNWSIAQDKNDWIYFANNNGLLEFDGNEWTIYPVPNYTNVRSVYYDWSNDRYYVGAFDEFGYFKRDSRGKMIYYSLVDKLDKQYRSFNEVWGIEKQGNAICFQSAHYIFRYENEKITSFFIKNKITKMAVANSFLILATETGGAYVFNGNMLMSMPNNDILKNKKISAILPYQNSILFVTESDGIFLFDNQSIVKMNTILDAFLLQNQIFCGTIRNGTLALGTVRNGLVVVDLQNNTITFSNVRTGLQNNTVLSVNFDRLGNLWLGLDKGISFLNYNSSVYDFFGNDSFYGTGYASALEGNDLYLGTNQGLYVSKYPFTGDEDGQTVKMVENIQGQIWNLYVTDKTVFCGGEHGAYVIQGNRNEKIKQAAGTWGFKVFPNKPDYVLASSYNGFFLLKKNNGQWTFSNYIAGFKEYGSYFEIDNDSHVWFGHWRKGVYRLTLNNAMDSIVKEELFDMSKGLFTIYNNRVFKINNRITISGEHEYYRYDPPTNRMVKFSFFEKLFGNPSSSMKLYQAINRDIWEIGNGQISCAVYHPEGKYVVDSTGFALLNGKLIPGFEHVNSLDSNKLLIGTEDGFSVIDRMKRRSSNDTIQKIEIKHVYLTEKKDSLISNVVNINKDNAPKLKVSQNSLRFEYSATEFRKEDAISYSYMLEGFDHDWSDYTSVRTKEYTNLKKGTYVFRVRAKNSYNFLTSEAEYMFTILPAWYESIWANIFYLLLISMLFFLAVKYFEKKSEKKVIGIKTIKEQEMKEQKERFLEETKKKEKEIINLKNQKLQYELRNKSQDLASSTMNLIRKNEILLEINKDLDKIGVDILAKKDLNKTIDFLHKIQGDIKKNIQHDSSWKKFQENFDLVYENYLKRLGEQYPTLTVSDKKLCAYLKMDLSSKEIAPLLNMSYRSVEMSRYRLRKKLNLSRDTNLTDFLQRF